MFAQAVDAAPLQHKVVVACEIETIEHINCGGGLRAPNEPPPDCSKGDVERSIAKRSMRLTLPSTDFVFRNGELGISDGEHAIPITTDRGVIYYSSGLSFYTDAAGFSFERGTCSIVSGRKYIRRQKASIQ